MPLKDKDDQGKRPPKYVDGTWLGINEVNSEVFIGTPQGVCRSRSILRRPDKWSRDVVEALVGVPWCHSGDGEDAVPKVTFGEQAPEEVALPASEHSSGTSAEDLRNGLKDAFKSDADKAAEKTGAVFGKVGQVAGKVAAKFGDALGVGANIAGAGYATEQEAKDVFGKHSHLEGDGNWEKAGNLVSMVGDDTALLGSLARFGGPEGAIIGTGAELVGGAIGLVGSGLDAIGEYFQGEKKTATASAVAKKAMPESAPVQTVAIQNTQGSGGIANVSQSALKQLN